MKPRINLTFISLLLLPVAGCIPPQDVEKEVAALKQQDSLWNAAFVAGDVDALMALYWNSADLVSYPPDTMEVRGYDALHQSFTQMFRKLDVLGVETLDVQFKVSGDLAVGWGRWSMTFQPTGPAYGEAYGEAPYGGPTEMKSEGRFSAFYLKQNGKWLIAADHASMPLPPSPPPAMEKKKK